MAQQTEHVTNNHTLTAVEWLLDEWPVMKSQIPPYIIEQAKAMEKEQIIEAFDIGTNDENLIGKEYYNETYNK
jgi:hypothetical protein